jgi:hypothetical protein
MPSDSTVAAMRRVVGLCSSGTRLIAISVGAVHFPKNGRKLLSNRLLFNNRDRAIFVTAALQIWTFGLIFTQMSD